MSRNRCCIVCVLLAVAGAAVGAALGSDDESEPLYVVHNGKLVPTMIIPPPRGAASVPRPAVIEVVEAGARDASGASGGVAEAVGDLAGDEDGTTTDRAGRRYTLGRFAGYPVSIPSEPGWTDWYGSAWPPSYYGQALEETYRAERYIREREHARRFNERDMKQRKERVLASHEKALRAGLEDLKSKDYAQAVVAFEMAANLNQGDPACRIHLTQARLAQGHFDDAATVLRRALQLQPKLAYVALSLDRYYADADEFDTHIDALASYLHRHPGTADTWFLLGYLEFQRGKMEPAHAAFQNAARMRPRDSLTETYLQITKPARK